jgi:hypothetical protein
MSEHLQFDNFFKKRLQNHESEVPHALFNRLMEERNAQQPEFDTIFQGKLKEYESAVPTDSFDNLMRKRDWQHSPIYGFFRRMLVQHEAPVPVDMFERVMQVREFNHPVALWQRRDVQLSLLLLLLLLVASIGFNLIKNEINKADLKNISTGNAVQSLKSNIADNISESSSNAEKLRTTVQKDSYRVGNKYGITQNITSNNNKSNQEQSQTYAGILKAQAAGQKAEGAEKYAGSYNTDYINKTQSTENKTPIQTTNSNSGIHPKSSSLTQTQQVSAATEHNAAAAVTQQFYNPMNILTPLMTLVTEGVSLKEKSPCGDPGNGCPTFGRRVKFGSFANKSWYLDAYWSPEVAHRSLSLKTVEGEALLRARDTTEKVLYGWSTGSRASLVFDNGLAFRAGVVYAVNNERFQKDSIDKQEILRIDRQTGELLGIDVVNTIYRQTRYNKYRSIDFTLQAGYEVPINDFLIFSINGGANLNYRSAKKVRFQTAMGTLDSVVHTFGERSPAVFENTWGVSLIGSAAGYLQITNRMQLMIEPHIRYYMRPLTRPDYSLNQRYTATGLIIGLRYRL